MTSDPAFDAWKQRAADADILDVAERVLKVKFAGRKRREMSAPCPRCGGEDRFSINTVKQVFNCRGAGGGVVVSMVMHGLAIDFLAACETITGEPPPARGTQLTPEAQARADEALKASKARAERREADFNAYRQRERERTADMYNAAHPFEGSSAADYMTLRGLAFPPTEPGRADRLRCIESLPYVVHRQGQEYEVVHSGPAMVARIVDDKRLFRGLHITYLDLAQPKGKLALDDPKTGKRLDAKKSRGSKQGNHIELIGPREPTRLVLGEGIEKVVAVYMALAQGGEQIDGTAFWSACDLGNLAGPAADKLQHPDKRSDKGRPLSVDGMVPDLEKPGITIPDSVTDLVLLGDTTSDDFGTRVAMCRAHARYMRPGLTVRVAWSPAGEDFDDPWRNATSEEERAAVAAQIRAMVDQAAAPMAPEILSAEPKARKAKEHTTARASVAAEGRSEPGARDDQTGDGAAGAPSHLSLVSSAPADASDLPDPDEAEIGAALGLEPPLASAPAARALSVQNEEPSRMGRSRGRGGSGNDGGDADADEQNRKLAFYAQTDLGNAERMRDRYAKRLKFSPAHGWLAWNGKAYSAEEAGAAVKMAEHETVRAIQDEAKAVEAHASGFVPRIADRSTDDGKVVDLDAKREKRKLAKELKAKRAGLLQLAADLRKFGRKSESRPRMAALSDRAVAWFTIAPNKLDADPFKINVANGTLIVRRDWSRDPDREQPWRIVNEFIRFKPHDPADLITKISPVEFDAAATCPVYDEFLAYVQPVEENRRHLHQCGGISLTGDISEQVMWFNWGKGKNGKSTLFNIWSYVIGEYGRSVAIETFLNSGMTRSGAQASPDLARLAGVRMVRTSEPERGAKLAEALIKLATGGEPMTVRHLNKEVFELLPRFKLIMAGNYRPEIRGTDEGIWRRMRLVPWTVSIPPDKRDRDFGDKLQAEGSGILNRLLEGLVDWLKHGLNTPHDVEQATAEYRKDSDPLGRFLDACVVSKEGYKEQSSEVHRVFCAWCKANGEKEWTATGFGKAMAERGFQRKHSDVNWWLHIQLVKHVGDFDAGNEPPPHGEPIENDVSKPPQKRPDDDVDGF